MTSPPGFWSVGIVLDGAPGQHIVSYAYTITVTDLTTGEVLYANGSTKPGTRGQESLDCSDVTLTTDPDTGDSISIDFQTTVFLPGGTGER